MIGRQIDRLTARQVDSLLEARLTRSKDRGSWNLLRDSIKPSVLYLPKMYGFWGQQLFLGQYFLFISLAAVSKVVLAPSLLEITMLTKNAALLMNMMLFTGEKVEM